MPWWNPFKKQVALIGAEVVVTTVLSMIMRRFKKDRKQTRHDLSNHGKWVDDVLKNVAVNHMVPDKQRGQYRMIVNHLVSAVLLAEKL